jgi:hypothetical protein
LAFVNYTLKSFSSRVARKVKKPTMSNHFYYVTVNLGQDGEYVFLGQLGLNTTVKEIGDKVLAMKNVNGLVQVFLGYIRPHNEFVLLPGDTKLSEAASAISQV